MGMSRVYTIKIEFILSDYYMQIQSLGGGLYFNSRGDKDQITKIVTYGQGVSPIKH